MLMYYKYDEFSMNKAMGSVAKNEENGNSFSLHTNLDSHNTYRNNNKCDIWDALSRVVIDAAVAVVVVEIAAAVVRCETCIG